MKDYLPGTEIIPGWEIVRLIGGGGFGKVYEAKKPDSGVGGDYRSAIKVIPIPHSDEDVEAYRENGYDEESITTIFRNQVEDFSAEFALMSQFKGTANIVSYEDHLVIQHDDGIGWDVFIRMELLSALPIKLKEEGMTGDEVISLGIDVCSALELCAKKNIIHRDIKPQNIFLNEFGNYKLGDFGIARMMDHKTRATITGTPDYMAPEVRLGKPYDASADQYSLGMMMYWILNERRLPFLPLPPAIESAREQEEALARRISGDPLPAPKNGSDALKEIVLRACAFNPEDRYPNPTAMKRALLALSGEDSGVRVLEPMKKKGTASVKSETVIPRKAEETKVSAVPTKPEAPVRTSETPASHAPKNEYSKKPAVTETKKAEAEKPSAVPAQKQEKKKTSLPVIVGIAVAAVLIVGGLLVFLLTRGGSGEGKKEISEIFLSQLPEKLTYLVGDTPDLTGLTLTVRYDDGSEKTVTSGFTFEPSAFDRAGEQTVTVTYQGKTAVLNVEVSGGTVSAVSVATFPAKYKYSIGETIDLTGLTLNVTYSDGKSATVSEGFTCTPTVLETYGTITITVTYGGAETSFSVTVG